MTDSRNVIDNQITYYRAQAAGYDTAWPNDRLAQPTAVIRRALRQFSPSGRVLEIACGTGNWTQELVLYADELVALDASEEMLRINAQKLGHERGIRYLNADLFSWAPEDRYHVVFFALWLSHVPPALFDSFWSLVETCLNPGGRVFFVDELPHEMWSEEYVDEEQAIVRRRVTDGTEHELVKVYWDPDDLKRVLQGLGWELSIASTGPLYWGEGRVATT